MAVTETPSKRTSYLNFTPAGSETKKNVNIGTLNPDAWDAEKAMAIMNSMSLVLDGTNYQAYTSATNEMIEGD